jgi:hypothetical protein
VQIVVAPVLEIVYRDGMKRFIVVQMLDGAKGLGVLDRKTWRVAGFEKSATAVKACEKMNKRARYADRFGWYEINLVRISRP